MCMLPYRGFGKEDPFKTQVLSTVMKHFILNISAVFLLMSALICSPATSKIYHVTELKLKLDGTKCDPDNKMFLHCNV